MSGGGRAWLVCLLVCLWTAAARGGGALARLSSPARTSWCACSTARRRPSGFFSPAFLAQVPPARVKRDRRPAQGELRRAPGQRCGSRRAARPAGTVVRRFRARRRPARDGDRSAAAASDRGAARRRRRIDGRRASPALFGEIVGLPGEVSLAAARLEEAGPADFLTQKAERPLAIGSAFKLFVLAELVRAVKAGERRWSDVVPLDRQSLPSGLLQDWPKGSPITLHSLAALMISRSDNSAADTLLRAARAGRRSRRCCRRSESPRRSATVPSSPPARPSR